MTHVMLLPTEPLEILPVPEPADDGRAFYSEDAATLTAWLYAGRGPICTDNPLLLEMVRRGYTGRPRGKW
jgi:hypothetical protein